MWRVLFSVWFGVVEAVEGTLDIPRHRNVAGSCFVIPVSGEADVAATGPVGETLVFFLQNFEETVNLRFVGVADSKIVYDEGEHGFAMFVFPKARGDGTRGKAARGKVYLTRASLASLPAWGRPYMPFRTSA
jgi:hypothetical protein